jgi:uncharacterized membrane protein YadS
VSQQPAKTKADKQRRLAPVFFVLAVIIAGLGVAQAIEGISWLAVISDFIMAAVLVALGLRVLKPPPAQNAVKPLRAPRPPR